MVFRKAALSDLDENRRTVGLLYKSLLQREADDDGLEHFVGQLTRGTLTVGDVIQQIVEGEEYRSRSTTTLCFPPGHFYSPIVSPTEAEKHMGEIRSRPVPDRMPGIALDPEAMVSQWEAMLPFMLSAPFTAEAKAGYRYRYDNPAYSYGDGLVLHAMLRMAKPKRVIEVGSGWSSALTLDTVEHFLGGACELTFIEPYPALLLELIGDSRRSVAIRDHGVQDTPLELFDSLKADDILFIDSTHVLKTGSDVWFELTQVLPRLKPGVLVHLHDMFWPFEYPHKWVVEENRSWNELYGVHAFLVENASWDIAFFNNYHFQKQRPLIERTLPLFLRNSGGALWLRRKA